MTIHVDADSCARCGICGEVCPMGIISPDGDGFPEILPQRAPACLSCGQCEAFCATGSLILDHPDGYTPGTAWKGEGITPELMSSYLRTRRSIRQFTTRPVPRDLITALLDNARYAASGGNGQPVEWLVIHDPAEVQQVASLTIGWMKTLLGTDHPMSGYVPSLIAGWEAGVDVICRNAPHLIIPHIPKNHPVASVDAIIALTHVDLAAPAYGVGACWAGFVAGASWSHPPLIDWLGLPEGRSVAYALMLGYPKYTPSFIPDRKPLAVTWR